MECITKDEVVSLLTQDSYYRRLKEWPLISFNEFSHFSYSMLKREVNSMFTIDNTGNCFQQLNSYEKFSYDINMLFPFTSDILIKFNNHLISCGGAIVKSLFGIRYKSDLDFFFYDLDVYQASQLRVEIIKFMMNIWRSAIGSTVTRYHDWDIKNNTIILDVKFYLQRNEYVTTLHVEELCDFKDSPKVYIYQFVHRIYPSISSVIGGFDLSSCMFAYDGREIYNYIL